MKSIYTFLRFPDCLFSNLEDFAFWMAQASNRILTIAQAHVVLIEAGFYEAIDGEFLQYAYRAIDIKPARASLKQRALWKQQFASTVGELFSPPVYGEKDAHPILPEGYLEVRYVHRVLKPAHRQSLLLFACRPDKRATYLFTCDPKCIWGQSDMDEGVSERLYFRLPRPLIIAKNDLVFVDHLGEFWLAHRRDNQTDLQRIDLPADIVFSEDDKPAGWYVSSPDDWDVEGPSEKEVPSMKAKLAV